jgi:hypothetical protein
MELNEANETIGQLEQRLLAEQTSAGKQWREAALILASGADGVSALFRPALARRSSVLASVFLVSSCSSGGSLSRPSVQHCANATECVALAFGVAALPHLAVVRVCVRARARV